ncbi:MAG: AbrB/MazE/SpoVT family DNA-binding domain-containing protein [Pseudomonadota bacterium]|nr:AbrB/MazE/SpoVT family DNA-binding domain-containing protein [Pseudomonadota bacterium]
MATSTLTTKGQITIPQSVRKALGLQAGDKIDFVQEGPGTYKVVALRKDAKALRGRFAGRVSRPVSIDQMAEAIASEATKQVLGKSHKQGKRSKSA